MKNMLISLHNISIISHEWAQTTERWEIIVPYKSLIMKVIVRHDDNVIVHIVDKDLLKSQIVVQSFYQFLYILHCLDETPIASPWLWYVIETYSKYYHLECFERNEYYPK